MNRKPKIQQSNPKDSQTSKDQRVLEGLDNEMKDNAATEEQKHKPEKEAPSRLTPHNA